MTDSLFQGVRVPEVLRKYIPGAPEFIEYTRELPKDSTSNKAKSEASSLGTKARPERDISGKMAEMKV